MKKGVGYLEQRLDLGVEPPPLPVAELEVGRAVALQDADCIQLLHPLLVVPAKITINTRLNVCTGVKNSKKIKQ